MTTKADELPPDYFVATIGINDEKVAQPKREPSTTTITTTSGDTSSIASSGDGCERKWFQYVTRILPLSAWTTFIVTAALFGFLLVIFRDSMFPSHDQAYLFSIFLTCVFAYCFSLPFQCMGFAEAGMIFGGVVVASMNPFDKLLEKNHYRSEWEFKLVEKMVWGLLQVSMAVLMFRAGLSVNLRHIWSNKWTIGALSVLPGCLVEACVVAGVSTAIIGFPYKFGFLLGFILASCSSLLVSHSILELKNACSGHVRVKRDTISTAIVSSIPAETLVSIGAIIPILESSFSIQPNHLYAPYWPLLPIMSISSAVGLGFLLHYLPPFEVNSCARKANISKSKLFALVLMVSAMLVMGEAKFMKEANGIPVGISGILAAVVFAAVLGRNNRQLDVELKEWADVAWSWAKYPMFGLTGYITMYVYREGKKGTVYNHSTGEFDDIEQDAAGLVGCAGALAIVAAGLVARLVTSFVVTHCFGMQWKERLFLALSGIPKTATLTFPFWVLWVMDEKEPIYGDIISSVLKVSGVAVFLTVPLGVIATKVGACLLLRKNNTDNTANGEEGQDNDDH